MQTSFKDRVPYVLIVAGALLASFSVACILLPNDAVDYGTAGIAIIINRLTGFNLSVCVIVILLPFLILCALLLGRGSFMKALVGSAAYSIGLEVFEKIPFELDTEHFLAVMFGGALLGLGLSLILRNGGTIDGSEILANILVNKLHSKTGKEYSMSPILIAFNVCVYAAVFVLIDQTAAMMSLLVYVVATVVIDHLTDHYDAIKQVTIITKHPRKLIADIKEELNKTCTIIESSGAIAGENKTLICYINFFELQRMREIIARNPDTFSTVSTIDEIIK